MNKKVKSILRWPGAKWRIARWIIEHFPQHETYLEPFFGSGAVFFTKPPSGTETINDLDDNIVNLFKVCRDYPMELAGKMEMTPYAKSEYMFCKNNYKISDCHDSIERARRFLTVAWQGFGSNTYQETSWAHDRTNTVFRPKYFSQVPERILDVLERLKMAQIENRNALELIDMYNRKNCLIYADPPYIRKTRTKLHYRYEFAAEEQHKQLLEVLLHHKGPMLVSSYSNQLYDEILVLENGWDKQSIRVQTNAGHSSMECLYMNPVCNREINLF